MNSIAIERPIEFPALTPPTYSRREFKRRTARLSLPWNEVPVRNAQYGHAEKIRRFDRPLLILLVVALHGALAWYATYHVSTEGKKPHVEIAVELVTPPKPPERIDPPKPQAPTPVKQAQVLPQIQTAAPEPSDANVATSAEPAVAVAPIVSAPPAPEVEPVTEAYGRAGLMNNPAPDYPTAAARVGWEGVVMLRVKVLASGAVAAVEVQQSSGHRILDDAATRTVKTWTFSPSKRGNTAIDGWATVPIEFKLDS